MGAFKKYHFRYSKIWEAGNPVDPNSPVVTVKAKSEARARKRLPEVSLGRVWLLMGEVHG